MKLYWFSLMAYGLFSSHLALADDTEIYRNTSNRINPNVIFLIDTSGSMAYEAANNSKPESGELSRLDIVKNSAVSVIQQLSTSEPINIAVMRFDERRDAGSNSLGGVVLEPFTATNNSTNKNVLISQINSLNLNNIGGGTPITEALYEAALYMTGKEAEYGEPRFAPVVQKTACVKWKKKKCLQYDTWEEQTYFKAIGTYYYDFYYQYYYDYYGYIGYNTRYTTFLGSDPASFLAGTETYKSPVEATCQKNHIVLFTDGDATADEDSNPTIKELVEDMSLPTDNSLSKSCSGNGGCSEELAYWMQNTDHYADSDITGNVDPNAREINQPIYVHTVGGFSGISDSGKKRLNNIAKYGHPLTASHLKEDGSSKHYYSASDEAGLTKALLQLFGGIANTAGNFAAPVVAVNAFNSLEHRDELYYSVFQPAETPGWSGNIKRYRMDSSGTILDQKDKPAIDPQTGFFRDEAQSFWTLDDSDGSIVTNGGIANRLPGSRKVYTLLSGLGNLVSSSNLVTPTNTSISKAMLSGLLPSSSSMTDAVRRDVLTWAQGTDPSTGKPHHQLPDPLHGNPVLMTYRVGSSTEDVLFSGTNAGFIHAFDPDSSSPSELWSFIPKELLPNLTTYQLGFAKVLKTYGIDGPLSIYHADSNNDRIIDSGEKAYLTAGMRRGGSHYYLLDISDKAKPVLAGQISGGNTGFEELGQTWSRMIPATVTWNGKKTPVYFFGGGYDTREDSASTRITHNVGNAIYMVKATSDGGGKAFDLLWKATGRSTNSKGLTFSDMDSSFAGDLSLVDNDGNGTVDLIYGADVGGRLWRFDIDKNNSGASNFAQGGIIADFNDGSVAGNIRFYTQPDVVYTEYGQFEVGDPADPTKTILTSLGRYQISIGSGFRAGPLSTAVKDKVFVLNDFDTLTAPLTYTTKKIGDMADFNNFSNATAAQQKNGFYYALPGTGEKVLSTTLTVNDVIYIPTFRPSESNIEIGCEPDTGQARLIMIKPLYSSKTTERSIETVDLEQGGIVPKPILVFPPSDSTGKPSKPVIAIGTEVMGVSGDFNAFQRTYWREN